jgi:hypothetical protein
MLYTSKTKRSPLGVDHQKHRKSKVHRMEKSCKGVRRVESGTAGEVKDSEVIETDVG